MDVDSLLLTNKCVVFFPLLFTSLTKGRYGTKLKLMFQELDPEYHCGAVKRLSEALREYSMSGLLDILHQATCRV